MDRKLPKEQQPKNKEKRRINPALKYSGMAAQMALFTALGFFGGRWIDNKLELQKPVFALLLLVLFLAAFMVKLIKDVSEDK